MPPYRFTALLLLGYTLAARSPVMPAGVAELRVHVYNSVSLSDDVLVRAESESARLLDRSLRIKWLNCTNFSERNCAWSFEKGDMIVRIVPHTSSSVRTGVLGEAVTAEAGVYAVVFYDRISALRGPRTSVSSVLGKVVAHEITHLLMGADSHAQVGVMRPTWSNEEFDFYRSGLWFYTPQQRAAMREQAERRLAGNCNHQDLE